MWFVVFSIWFILLILVSNILMFCSSLNREEESYNRKMKILDDFEKDMKDMFDKGFDVSTDDKKEEK